MNGKVRLVLIRHGKTQWNAERRYLGYTDLALIPGAYNELSVLRQRLEKVDFQTVYCSDLTRCRETLAYIRPDLKLVANYDARLREMNFGQWEGQTYEMLKNNPLYREWLDHPKDVTPPGGESWQVFENRVSDFMNELLETVRIRGDKAIYQEEQSNHVSRADAPNILIITHGGVIRMLYTLLREDADFWDLQLEPGSAVTIDVTLYTSFQFQL
ncbi:alpha-ribazole phosphatase family protein [Paenibacillus sediminis]|uniref:Alpha-ribazole phosphatase n=1 Tax=Paenibacillus sediminis TaxID=664909 RepID=A0ABS4H4L6_9BACL|nr:alpha-ribazole phosphatase family protein [Paenibacillus sediminis]MBP1937456.1 alpha-ribazole phosphatase [Paenibacillus sediminis]